MEDKKTEFRYFTISEWKKEQDYLRRQHKAGWKFIKVKSIGFYYFKRCRPEDVIYQLDYNQDGIKNKTEYLQMFSDCGWEYIQDYAGYSYFRKPVSEMKGREEEIFCDDASRIEMMGRVFKGRVTPMIVSFFLIIIPQLFLNGVILDGFYNNILARIFIVLLFIYILVFMVLGYQFLKYWQELHKTS